MKRLVIGLVAALYVIACFLPGEPSGAERIEFQLDFPIPYRVPLAGSAAPTIKVTAGGLGLSNPSYRLESLDEGIVRVDATGRGLQGITRGTAPVRVVYQAATGAPDTTFAAQVVVSRVAVVSPQGTLTRIGDTVRLEASAFDAHDVPVSSVSFMWTSADPTVATVSAAGLVTARNDGEAVVTAEADGATGAAAVAVVQAAAEVRMIPELDTLRTVGRATRFFALVFDDTGGVLLAARPRWSSSNESIARVDSTGLTTATGGGTARIVARVGTAADTATLVVAQVIRFLAVTPGYDTLVAIADTSRFTALALDSLNFPIPNPSVAWATSDAAVAVVDPAGLVQAARNGVVLITASAGGYSGFATVVVRQEGAMVRLAADSLLLTAEGEAVRLSAVVLDRTGHPVDGAPLAWRSLFPLVATVDSAGLVTARGGGRAEVVVRSGARSDTAIVTVTGVPAPRELIAFVGGSPDSAFHKLYVMNPDGSGVTRLTAESFATPAWSPDGTRIAFAGAFESGLYAMNADGSGVVRIAEFGFYPAWSPDGTKIAVGADALYVVNLDGSGITKLTDGYGAHPAWSPDGRKIAFDAPDYQEGVQHVWVMNADGSDVHRLTSAHDSEFAPAWSPDGLQIAFSSWYYGIVIINSDGSGVWRSVYDETDNQSVYRFYSRPAWSPDGTALVFNRSTTAGGMPELWLVNVDGSGPRMLRSDSWDATWRRVPRE